MPSKMSELMLRQLRRTKKLLGSMDIGVARKGQDALGALGATVLREHVVYSTEPFDNFKADWALPVEGVEDGIILYLHGGAYTAGTLSFARGFGGVLAHNTKHITLCVGYRLAPEHPFPAALDDALEAYRRIAEIYPSQKIVLAGESAGGGLCYALALKLKACDLPAPACIIALSPWTDLTCSGASYQTNAKADPYLFEDSLRQSAQFYANGDATNPFISPLHGNLEGIAPSLIYAGSIELLLDDSTQMADKLGRAGSFCELHVVEDMWHAFVLFGTPEAKDALERIHAFIDEHLAEI